MQLDRRTLDGIDEADLKTTARVLQALLGNLVEDPVLVDDLLTFGWGKGDDAERLSRDRCAFAAGLGGAQNTGSRTRRPGAPGALADALGDARRISAGCSRKTTLCSSQPSRRATTTWRSMASISRATCSASSFG